MNPINTIFNKIFLHRFASARHEICLRFMSFARAVQIYYVDRIRLVTQTKF